MSLPTFKADRLLQKLKRNIVEETGNQSYSHVVEGYSHFVVEVFAEERNLGVALAEVVQHDEVRVHLHADADGLRGRAGGTQRRDTTFQFPNRDEGRRFSFQSRTKQRPANVRLFFLYSYLDAAPLTCASSPPLPPPAHLPASPRGLVRSCSSLPKK